jgi:DGQHR domain-containing protein
VDSIEQERNTIRFLEKMGFKDVNGGNNFLLGGRQVDACGGENDTLLIIECTTQANLTPKIDSFKGKKPEVISGFKKDEKYSKYKSFRFILVIDQQEVTQSVLDHAKAEKGNEIYIWNQKYIDYYLSLEKSTPDLTRYSILAELNVKPPKTDNITVPAILYKLGRGKDDVLLIFFIKAKELLKYSYVARRKLGESNFQRMVNQNRLKQIATYINKGKIFPNSIVIGLEDKGFQYRKLSDDNQQNWSEIVHLTIGLSYSSCWIIDGQHRLLSYCHTSVNGIVAVSAFGRIKPSEQAEYFIDINKNAKQVDPNLLWDLLGSISPLSGDGFISTVVKEINSESNSFFYHKIKIPSIGGGEFNFNSLCEAIKDQELAEKTIGSGKFKKERNPFSNLDLSKFCKNLAKGINFFFTYIDNKITVNRTEKIWTDGIISVLIAVYKVFIVHQKGRIDGDSIERIFNPFIDMINTSTNEERKVLRRRLSSEAGRTDLKKEIIKMIQETSDADFGKGLFKQEKSLGEEIKDLEFDFNRFVNAAMIASYGDNWFSDTRYFTDVKERDKAIKQSSLEGNPPWEYLNLNTTVSAIISNNSTWEAVFKSIFNDGGINTTEELKIYASKMMNYRNKTWGHKRSAVMITKEEEDLVKTFYGLFKKIISKYFQA